MGDQDYMLIPTVSLRAGIVIGFELYRREKTDKGENYKPIFKKKVERIPHDAMSELLDKEYHYLYIHASEFPAYREYLNRNIEILLNDAELPMREKARILYYAAKLHISKCYENPRLPVNIESTREVIRQVVGFVLKDKKAFVSFLNMNQESNYLLPHAINVAVYGSALLNTTSRASRDVLESYAYSALLHDLGMREVPREILTKPEKLTADEFRLVKKHPVQGASFTSLLNGIQRPVDAVILQHHERMDGNGYPWGLRADEIHPLARVCAIADVFDALTSSRSYKAPLSTFDAFKIMKVKERGKFDREILDAFIRLMST